jgi:hypothetical protein
VRDGEGGKEMNWFLWLYLCLKVLDLMCLVSHVDREIHVTRKLACVWIIVNAFITFGVLHYGIRP